jgi:O-antigen ligase
MSKTKNKKQVIYRAFFIVLWSLAPLMNYVRIMWMRLPVIGKFHESLVPTIIVISILLASNKLLRRIKKRDFVFYSVLLFVYLMNYVWFPDNEPFLDEYFYSFAILALPYYFAGVSFDIRKCWSDLFRVSFISIICFGLFKFILISSNYEFEKDSDMTGAYQLLPHLLLCIWAMFQKRTIWRIGIVVYGVFLLLGQGNRGSVLSLLIFVVLFLLFVYQTKFRYKFLSGIIGGTLIVFYKEINDYLFSKMEEFGLSTRLFSMYLEGELTDSTGRDEMFSQAINAVKNSPLFGYGITGDRYFSGGLAYIHNFLFEILIAFGPIIGSFIFISLLILLAIGLKVSSRLELTWLLILICVGFIPLFISGTFLTTGWFFFMIGFCISVIRNHQNKE